MHDEQVERLLADLEVRSRQEIEQVLSDARASAARTAANTDGRKAERRADAVRFLEADAAARRVQALADARRTALGALLQSQYAAVDRIIGVARELVSERLASDVALPGLLPRMAALLEYLGDVPARVRCRDALAARVSAALPPTNRVIVDPSADAPAGFVITDENGRLTIDDTVDAWLARERPRIAIEVRHAMETRA